MNKKTVMCVLLVLFAVLAVYVAFMPGSVAVYDLSPAKEPSYCTYFNLVEDVELVVKQPTHLKLTLQEKLVVDLE